ncbi:transmembrane protein 94 isoform X1 [Rhopalosiphum maidis]|uniref:transmembrane protein 94 isoform X1 n=1 Tax=Rhopalosiphum maidis TaxID=43146 RepID=UPI000EFF1EE8|nr:transmembrane protein 94 isoform X1 [Rhopalosiphum maidis]XP_026818267.1 transmembrane protein 94 isoform X1 [Rhopalosiphum maidis]XP_026818268.1 transmembrane protein 94 isoform X1 [Rhopalosiphum maidis]
MTTEGLPGLSTTEALHTLYNEILSLRNHIKDQHTQQGKDRLWIQDALKHNSPFTSICWITALIIFACGFSLVIISLVYDEMWYLFDDGILLFILLTINLATVLWDNKLRHEEMFTKLDNVMKKLNCYKDKCHWKKENYPHLCMPFSPSVTLQWTQRDGVLVNLPWALLVKGDIVLLKPGQTSPCHVSRLRDKDKWAPAELTRWEIFNPDIASTMKNKTTVPTMVSRNPLKNVAYILNETPYLNNLKLALELSQNRPCSFYTKCLYLLQIIFMQKFAAATFLGCTILTVWWRWSYVTLWLKSGTWVSMFIVIPISILIPLLPLMLPIAWTLMTCYGNAVLQSSSIVQKNKDLFEETETEAKNNSLEFSFKYLWKNFYSCILGNSSFLHRSTNLLHVMGSVTALCCVDKKGILSWPNPTAEKVFFLQNPSKSSSMSNYVDTPNCKETQRKSYDSTIQNQENYSVEVLDLTHDRGSAWRLQFDDATWSNHITSLKPLGLAVLLNTCNPSTHAHYAQFCAHVSCQALYSEVLVPVTNRRCLCELARQIGFSESADDIFELQLQLSTYRHVQADAVRRDIKFARSLPNTTKLKFPFPHMVCVGLRERSIGKAATSLQLFSQGTADIILDACIDFWDGHDLSPVSPSVRKKVLDFYQRTSLTAYCTAFSYRPLPLPPDKSFSEMYLELPADCRQLYSKLCRSPTPQPWTSTSHKIRQQQFHSSDSLLFGDCSEYNSKDVNCCFETQCNQIFLGMVTMQYQPQYDMVQLIELLETACIRFVHFSKENELRSRVFSEKMGLESGWNCHISLLGDTQTRTRLDPSEGAATCDDETSFLIPLTSTSQSKKKLAEYEHNLSADCFPPLNINCTALNMSRTISMSAPTALNMDYAQVTIEHDGEKIIKPMLIQKDTLMNDNSNVIEIEKNGEEWHSLSCISDSTDQSVPVNFDMYNRAKLPRGIENIRPHLECIDNVPLLVSLFTDCTPEATKEMISIMQQYGEVVCVLGSSPNAENIGIFMQADASLAIEPIYPQVCQRISIMQQPSPIDAPISPVGLSELLNSLPCCLSLNRQDPLPVYHLIMEGRYLMQGIWNCVQFWTSCMVSLSFLQLLAIALVLPPILSVGQILWLTCIVVPLLSVSLVGGPTDPEVMQKPTGKNQCSITSELSYYVMWFYGLKFLPVVINMVLLFIWSLSQACDLIISTANNNSTIEIQKCWYVYPDPKETEWGGWSKFEPSIISVQRLMLLFLVMHYVTVSLSFVHRDYLLWKRTIHLNKPYLFTSLFIILVQWAYTIHYEYFDSIENNISISKLSMLTFIIGFVSLFLVFIVNEIVHWQEIRLNVRYQKRARLDFGTKLGMNSPF